MGMENDTFSHFCNFFSSLLSVISKLVAISVHLPFSFLMVICKAFKR